MSQGSSNEAFQLRIEALERTVAALLQLLTFSSSDDSFSASGTNASDDLLPRLQEQWEREKAQLLRELRRAKEDADVKSHLLWDMQRRASQPSVELGEAIAQKEIADSKLSEMTRHMQEAQDRQSPHHAKGLRYLHHDIINSFEGGDPVEIDLKRVINTQRGLEEAFRILGECPSNTDWLEMSTRTGIDLPPIASVDLDCKTFCYRGSMKNKAYTALTAYWTLIIYRLQTGRKRDLKNAAKVARRTKFKNVMAQLDPSGEGFVDEFMLRGVLQSFDIEGPQLDMAINAAQRRPDGKVRYAGFSSREVHGNPGYRQGPEAVQTSVTSESTIKGSLKTVRNDGTYSNGFAPEQSTSPKTPTPYNIHTQNNPSTSSVHPVNNQPQHIPLLKPQVSISKLSSRHKKANSNASSSISIPTPVSQKTSEGSTESFLAQTTAALEKISSESSSERKLGLLGRTIQKMDVRRKDSQ